MALTLMYITNNPIIAQIAENAGVDRIWVDMEYIGKDDRQKGMDTVKSHHTIEDVKNIRKVVKKSELLVRVNPLHEKTDEYINSKTEIDAVIKNGADIIMLPMFKTAEDVKTFINYVDGRARVQLLVETKEAMENLDEILEVPGIDEVHIGLNDLHLALNKTFMFELLCDDIVKNICEKLRRKNIKYGFGGIARVGYGLLPAEYIIAEHYHLGSTAAILSRDFCNANKVENPLEIKNIFYDGVKNIREKEMEVSRFSEKDFQKNLEIIRGKVNQIVLHKRGK